MMLDEDGLFLVGCVKWLVIKNFMCETAGNSEIGRALLSYPSTGTSLHPVCHPALVFVRKKKNLDHQFEYQLNGLKMS